MVPSSAGPSAREEIDDLREHDREVLEFLSRDPSSQVAFQGLRRRLGIHPEQLSRALHRLARDELVMRTELGYRVTPKAVSILSPSAFERRPGVTVLQTYLPADVDLLRLVAALRGTWIGPLRWYGLSETSDEMRMSWVLEDDGLELEVRIRAGHLAVLVNVEAPVRMDHATRLGHLLFQHIAREVSRDLYAGLSG